MPLCMPMFADKKYLLLREVGLLDQKQGSSKPGKASPRANTLNGYLVSWFP